MVRHMARTSDVCVSPLPLAASVAVCSSRHEWRTHLAGSRGWLAWDTCAVPRKPLKKRAHSWTR